MDFFHGLDNPKYGAFKMAMLNGWATTAVKPPKTPNMIYRKRDNASDTKEAIGRTEEGAKGPFTHSVLQMQAVQPLLHVQRVSNASQAWRKSEQWRRICI
jgi:hypothetical protein